MLMGFDYSFSRPSLSGLRSAGAHFVIRYLTGSGKAISKSEAAAIKAAGLDLVLNFETDGKMPSTRGAADGKAALAAANALGVPVRAIYFSLEAANTYSAQYMRDAQIALGKVRAGVYGVGSVVKQALDAGYMGWEACWGCSASSFDPRAQLRQTQGGHAVAGGDVDTNWATVADYGQCFYGGTPPPTPLPGGDMTESELRKLLKVGDNFDLSILGDRARADAAFFASPRAPSPTSGKSGGMYENLTEAEAPPLP